MRCFYVRYVSNISSLSWRRNAFLLVYSVRWIIEQLEQAILAALLVLFAEFVFQKFVILAKENHRNKNITKTKKNEISIGIKLPACAAH